MRQTNTHFSRCSMLEEVFTAHKTWFVEHNKIHTHLTDASTTLRYGQDEKVFVRQRVVHWPRTYLPVNSIISRKLYTSIVGVKIKSGMSQGCSEARTIPSLSYFVVSRDQLESSLRPSLFRLTKPYLVWKQIRFAHAIREEVCINCVPVYSLLYVCLNYMAFISKWIPCQNILYMSDYYVVTPASFPHSSVPIIVYTWSTQYRSGLNPACPRHFYFVT